MKKTFKSIAFGCRVNEAEKIVIDRNLTAAGFVQTETDPHIILINSCCVTGKAEREMRQSVYQLRRAHPNAVIVVTGCAATRWIRDGETPDEATLLVSNERKGDIVSLITEITGDLTPEADAPTISDKFTDSGRLMVKIQDGCHRFCSYCIVPYMRGKPVSRSSDEIIGEIRTAGSTIKEVTLTAINTEAYGRGTGETLTGLIDAILTKTDIPRLSFGSIHPWSITPEFLSYYKTIFRSPRFVHFFHIPIQSGCDSVLKRMNRQYTTDELFSAFTAIKAINPHAFIGTDVIVGFPGETEGEFSETLAFLHRAPIDRFHVFRYSVRPGTAAERMTATFPEPTTAEKEARSKILRKLSDEHFAAYAKNTTGTTTSTLLLREGDTDHRSGISGSGVPMNITGKNLTPATIILTRITGKNGNTLTGNPITE